MTVVSISVEKGLLEAFYAKVVAQFPSELVPESISDGENDKQFAISLSELNDGNNLPIDIAGGYFLHAADAMYGVSFSGIEAKLFVEVTFDENAKTILKQIAALPISYAYACSSEERE